MRKKYVITLFLMMISIFIFSPNFAQAEDNEMKKWIEESMNPSVDNVVKGFNEITKEYWYLNLSNYLLEEDKDKTIQDLELLREEIKTFKKEVNSIKPAKTADRKDKKYVKGIKKDLTKALNRMDKDAKKYIKRISKDKTIKEVRNKKFEEKRIDRASSKYLELNKKHGLEADELKFEQSIKINEVLAKDIINKHKKEIEKAEKKKELKQKQQEEEQKQEKKIEVLTEEQKIEKQEKLDAIIVDLVKNSNGAIKSIRPTSGDDWIAVYVTLDNSWYLLSSQEKEYFVNEMGPVYSSIIIASGVTDYSDVYFIDENGNTLASPKMFGGYKIHE